MTTVAFQGESGAYSEEAIIQHFGEDVKTLPCHAFEHIFDAVEAGQADYGFLPVENSTAGSINKSYDLLLEHDLKVHAEVLLRVRHCLLAVPGKSAAIREVRSHPQALAQCEGYLNRNGLVAVPWYDTAGSAKDLAAEPAEGVGAIASELAAKHYGLEVAQAGIEDSQQNFTRFFVLGKGDAEVSVPCKTSLVFAVPNTAGSLFNALGEFAARNINLTRLESRPRRNRPWQYVFYVDFDGHWQDPKAGEALVHLLSRVVFVKLLGSYPAAKFNHNERTSAQSEMLQI